MKDYLHLFTPVSEALPTEEGYYLCILYSGDYESISFLGSWVWSESGPEITHWLDISKLTTKERASKIITSLLPMAEFSYQKSKEACAHQEFLKEDLNNIRAAKEFLEL